jgi:deoxyribodipyrimidine photo-lyase
MTSELQQRYGCVIGQDYPSPIISVESAIKLARSKIFAIRQDSSNTQETRNIVEKHASRKFKPITRKKNSKTIKAEKKTDTICQQDLFQ